MTAIEANHQETVGLHEAYQVLNYNQQLIQFADSKAGNLIVINSLFIAAVQATGLKAAGSLAHTLQAGYVLLACIAVLYCLSVITSRGDNATNPRKDLAFFGDILARRSATSYVSEFRSTSPQLHLEDILRRTYVLAGIAQRKFASFGAAQNLTVYAATLWVASNALTLLG